MSCSVFLTMWCFSHLREGLLLIIQHFNHYKTVCSSASLKRYKIENFLLVTYVGVNK
jgi:hypothetical protein